MNTAAGVVERPEIAIGKSKTLRVVEIFGPTIQGEGAYIGRPTVFVRFGGCDYRCLWCDTMHAVGKQYAHEWAKKTAQDILDEVEALTGGKPILITISGGNPAIQQLEEFLNLAKANGHTFSMETQGSVSKPWFNKLDQLTLSPKPPSSGETTDWAKLEKCIAAAQDVETSLKVVVFNRTDYAYAQDVAARYPNLPMFLSIGNDDTDPQAAVDKEALHAKMRELIDWVNADKWYDVTILPQLHVMLWGNMTGV